MPHLLLGLTANFLEALTPVLACQMDANMKAASDSMGMGHLTPGRGFPTTLELCVSPHVVVSSTSAAQRKCCCHRSFLHTKVNSIRILGALPSRWVCELDF